MAFLVLSLALIAFGLFYDCWYSPAIRKIEDQQRKINSLSKKD